MRPSRLQALLVCLLTASLALPAAAAANDFQDVYREYKRSGTIKPCRFSNDKLRNAQRLTPPDVEQYAPSFLDAVQGARERSADCGKKAAAPAAAAPAPTPAATTSSGPPTPSTPTPTPQPAATTAAPATAAPPPAPTVPVQTPVKGVPSPPVANAKQDDSAPVAVRLLAILGGLILLSAVFAGLAWWFGWSAERFTRPFGASWSDFGGRAADLRGEFGDWIRSGN